MKLKIRRKHVVTILSIIIFVACVNYFVRQFLIPYDILISVPTQGWLFDTYDTYYEINAQWGVTKKTKKLPYEKYVLTSRAYSSGNQEEWEKHTDMSDYSYIKQYDPLMDYTGYFADAAKIHGYVYYSRINDMDNYYRFSNDTHEIKQIALDTIDKMILGDRSDWPIPMKNVVGIIEKLGYFDYYKGLNDVMMKYISLDDIKQPNLDLTGVSFIFNVIEINGRIFFNSGNKLYEFYSDTLSVKYITSVRGNPQYFSRFNVIGVSGK